jgi:Prolyl oligopeptidase family
MGAYVDDYAVWINFLIGQGWAVLRTNPRGSTNYGPAFAAANKNDLGGGDYTDIMAGVDYVLKTENVDTDRLAFEGYSYGGEMAGFVEGKQIASKRSSAARPLSISTANMEPAKITARSRVPSIDGPRRNPGMASRRVGASWSSSARLSTKAASSTCYQASVSLDSTWRQHRDPVDERGRHRSHSRPAKRRVLPPDEVIPRAPNLQVLL